MVRVDPLKWVLCIGLMTLLCKMISNQDLNMSQICGTEVNQYGNWKLYLSLGTWEYSYII